MKVIQKDIDEKEEGILTLLSQGRNCKEIASRLHMSVFTVYNRLRVLRKFSSTKNTVELVVWYQKRQTVVTK